MANLGQRPRILLIGKDVSAEDATRFGLGNESRFQRCRLADLRKPGALPQAKNDVAPLALTDRTLRTLGYSQKTANPHLIRVLPF